MIRLIETLSYRCLRYVRQPLGSFHVLVGPNASGKSTFLDAFAFLGKLVSEGAEAASGERAESFYDLIWGREGERLELAVEADIPEAFQSPTGWPRFDMIRYEVALGVAEEQNRFGILDECLWLGNEPSHRAANPNGKAHVPPTLFASLKRRGWKVVFDRTGKKDYILEPEAPQSSSYSISILPHVNRTVFSQLDEMLFPASTWLASLLMNGIHRIDLTGSALRRPSPPGKGTLPGEDGGNLPWELSELKRHHPERFKGWLAHVRTALPDVKMIRVVEKPEDKHRYIVLRYTDGLEVPSWMLSDGTLRLLALTARAYVPHPNSIYLVEEPETSLHPLNIELVMQSLQSVYDGQVLVATQAPAVLLATKLENVLVFSRDTEHGTRIEIGDHHPALRDWKGQPNLDVLFASGVLG
jgi:predicted ATPase